MDPETTARKIETMEIRGALEIAIAAAFSLLKFIESHKKIDKEFITACDRLKHARPTAVSLPNTVNYIEYLAKQDDDINRLVKKIKNFIEEQKNSLTKIAKIGSKRIEENDTILTHCNSQTAIEIIKKAFVDGKTIKVVCTETRPRGQGYLTARQFADAGIPTTLIIDSAVRFVMRKLEIDKVVVGADTVCANGAVINKIGTSQVAVIAHEFNVPVIVGCETIKFAPETLMGELIEIEDREHSEIHAPMKGVDILNPAFDTTPPEYIDVIVTEDGMISPYVVYDILREKFGWELTK